MKLFFFFLLISLNSLAAKSYSFELKVISEIDEKPVGGITVFLNFEDVFLEGITNMEGIVLFENLQFREFQIKLIDSSGNHEEYSQFCWNKKKKDFEKTVRLKMTLETFLMNCEKIVDDFFLKYDSTLVLDTFYNCGSKIFIDTQFPGGAIKMMDYISRATNYPENSIEMNEQGRVYIQFIVETNGEITNVMVIRGVSKDLDEEAKRVVSEMPRWTPSTCGDQVTRTQLNLPINFLMY